MSWIYILIMFKWGLLMIEGWVDVWFKEEGVYIEKGDEVFDVEIDKIFSSVEVFFLGVLWCKVVCEDEILVVGVLFGVVVEGEVSDEEIDVLV